MKVWQPVSSDGETDAKCPFLVLAETQKEAKTKAEDFLKKYQQDDIVYNYLCPKLVGNVAALVEVVEVVSNNGVFIIP